MSEAFSAARMMKPEKYPRSDSDLHTAAESFRKRPESETGWDRLKQLYTIKHVQYATFERSPEMGIVESAFRTSAVAGFLTGFLNHWKVTKETFMRQNRELKFMDEKDFMREAYKYQLKFACRHGVRFGLRLGFFTGLYCLSVTTFAMYNNKLGLKEYVASGVAAGALWQAKVGLGGLVVGGTVGGLLSCVAGLGCVKLMEYYDVDLASIRYQIHLDRLEHWQRREQMDTEMLVEELIEDAKKEIEDEKQIS